MEERGTVTVQKTNILDESGQVARGIIIIIIIQITVITWL